MTTTLAMPFPVHDWQFWAATLAGLIALWWLTKGFIPWRRILGRKDAPSRRARSRKATLTISAPTREANQSPND